MVKFCTLLLFSTMFSAVDRRHVSLQLSLLDAVRREKVTTIKQILKRNRSIVNDTILLEGHSPNTPLGESIMFDIKVAETLISLGANVERADPYGTYPIHRACMQGRFDIVKLLHSNGASIRAKDIYGFTPLHMACLSGHKEMVQFLIDLGADVNSANNFGQTPLHSAAIAGSASIVKLLFGKGARLRSADNHGRTPIMYAAEGQNCELVAEFISFGIGVGPIKYSDLVKFFYK